MRAAYYPGCSVHGMARDYGESIGLVCKRLGISLDEIEDWNCCGASAAHSIDHALAISLGARNLALVESMGLGCVVTPCAGCFSRLTAAAYEFGRSDALDNEIEGRLAAPLPKDVEVLHLLQLLIDSVGLDRIAAEVVRPLQGLRLGAYYGCLLTRPTQVTRFDDPEQPTSIDRLLRALGAETVDWSHKAECCGAGFAASETDIVLELGGQVLESARDAGADAIVVACPLCQTNLDIRQQAMKKRSGKDFDLPVVYFTQLMGLAFGFSPKALGMRRLLVDPRSKLRAMGIR